MDKRKIEICGNCVYYFQEKALMMGEKKEIGFCYLNETKRLRGKDDDPCDKYREGSHSI
jgi:hypothetical protein